jgi:DNA-binding NarL/FixJ family response regulator
MKTFFRKLARVKKRKAIQAINRAIAVGVAGYAFKYGRINQTTYTGAVSEIQNQHNKTPEALKYTIEKRGGENESLTAQKSELTYIQEELDALGLGKVNRDVTLVVGIPMPHSS